MLAAITVCSNPACKEGPFWLSDFLTHFPRQNEDAPSLFSWKLILFTLRYFSEICNEVEGRPSQVFVAGFVCLWFVGLLFEGRGIVGGREAHGSSFF